MEKWMLFAVGAALAWGLYGPALQHGAHTLAYPAGAAHDTHKLTADDQAAGRMKSLLGVGIAYFILAVLLPVVLLAADGQRGLGFNPGMIAVTVAGGAGALAGLSLMMAMRFNTEGTVGSLIAGTLGAVGAICVIYALSSGGSPAAVMPTVFSLAPIVNVAASYLWDTFYNKKALNFPEPVWFGVGIVMAAAGAWLVLAYKPSPGKPKPKAAAATAPAASTAAAH